MRRIRLLALALLGLWTGAAAQTFTYPNAYSLLNPFDSRIKYTNFAALVTAGDVEIARLPVPSIFQTSITLVFPPQATAATVAKVRTGFTQVGTTAGIADLTGAWVATYTLPTPFAIPAGAVTTVVYTPIFATLTATVTPPLSPPAPPPPVADTTPPTVSITAPGAGATVVGTNALTAVASDNVGVVGVQFGLDGANFAQEITVPPYTTIWNSTTVADGPHTINAVARDAAGNRASSTVVTVTVSNAPPSGTAESPSGSSIPPLTQLVQVDASGAVFTWTKVGTHAFVNTADSGGSGFDQILYKVKVIYAHQSGGLWWRWNGSNWGSIVGTP